MKNKKIKICYVASVDITVRFILLNQLKFLQSQDYEVFVVCSPGEWVDDIAKQGIKVKTIKIKRKLFSPFSDLVALFGLWRYFKKEKFDIVHTHTPKPGLIGQLAAKMAGIPIIVNTIHGLYFQNSSPFLKRKFFILIEKIAAKCSDLIFFVNKEDMKTVVKEGICSDKLIRYFGGGININKFNPKHFSQPFIDEKKEKLGIKLNQKIVGIVSRLVEEKGYLDLFEAFKNLIIKFPESSLLVVGPKDPEKKDAINPKIVENYGIEKNVMFLGERTDVDEVYSLMDIFVLPSHREGLAVSILEASAMEKPVIATDIRGCRESVDNGKTGILVPIKSPEKLAEAIIYFLENPTIAKEMGKNGRIKVAKEFDELLIFDRMKKEYDRLIQEKIK